VTGIKSRISSHNHTGTKNIYKHLCFVIEQFTGRKFIATKMTKSVSLSCRETSTKIYLKRTH
jgi:hypothetical protein